MGYNLFSSEGWSNLGADIYDATHGVTKDPTETLSYKLADTVTTPVVNGANYMKEGAYGLSDSLSGLARDVRDWGYDAQANKKKVISDLIDQGLSNKEIIDTLNTMKANGETFQGNWTDNPFSGTLASVAGGLLQGGATLEKGIGDSFSAPTQQSAGDGLARLAKGYTETGLGALQLATSATPLGLGVNTAFTTDTAGKVIHPVTEGISDATAWTQDLLGFDSGSQASQDIQDVMGTAGTIGLFHGVGKAGVSLAKGVGKAGQAITGTVANGVSAVGKKIENVDTMGIVKNAGEGLISKTSGLEKGTISDIVTSPKAYEQARTGKISRENISDTVLGAIETRLSDLSELGKGYETIRNSKISIEKSRLSSVVGTRLQKELGTTEEGSYNITKLPVKARGAIEQVQKYIDEYGDIMTPDDLLSMRSKLDDLADYNTSGNFGQKIIKGLRHDIDTLAGEVLPGLKTLDKQYGPERVFLSKIKRDVLNPDGTPKDNILSVLANVTNKGKEAKLDRIEKLVPGIGEKIRAVRAYEDVIASSGKKVGAYAQGALIGASFFNPVALAGLVATSPGLVARALEMAGTKRMETKGILEKAGKKDKGAIGKISDALRSVPKSKVMEYIGSNEFKIAKKGAGVNQEGKKRVFSVASASNNELIKDNPPKINKDIRHISGDVANRMARELQTLPRNEQMMIKEWMGDDGMRQIELSQAIGKGRLRHFVDQLKVLQ